MKKQTVMKALKGAFALFLLAIVALQVVAVISPDAADAFAALLGFGGSGAGSAMAATTVLASNTREATDTARPRSATDPGHIDEDVSSFVTQIKPDDFSLDTILRSMESTEKAKDLVVNFEEVEFRGHQDAIGAAFTASGGTALSDKFVDITVDNPSLWVKGETIYVPSVLVSGKPLMLRVDTINSDNTLKVTAINVANNVVPSIADNTVLYRAATAYGELRAKAENKTLIPGNRYNYCQRHMGQVEEGYIRSQIDTKTGFNIQDQNFIRMYDMRTEMEKASIFGQRAKIWSQDENEYVYYADGIYHQLENQLEYTTAGGITNNTWIDWTRDIFADNSGAEDRVLFGGSRLIANILKISSVEKQLDADRVELVPGLKIMKVETSFGELYIKHHKLFDSMGHAHDGMVVDMTNIKRRVFAPLSQRPLKLREAGISNVNATLIEEIFCLETRYLDTHARIKNTSI